jgi:DNA repair exonuclease SbcCD ATPase subunit
MSIAPEDFARQRFKPVAKVFEKIARLEAELAETRGQVEQLKNEQAAAAQRDRLAYAAALSEGKGKPSSCEEAKVSAELEDAELKAEALTLALDAAFDERARLLEQNRSGWRRQSMRELARARSRYESAIAELEVARDALSGEATLIAAAGGVF